MCVCDIDHILYTCAHTHTHKYKSPSVRPSQARDKKHIHTSQLLLAPRHSPRSIRVKTDSWQKLITENRGTVENYYRATVSHLGILPLGRKTPTPTMPLGHGCLTCTVKIHTQSQWELQNINTSETDLLQVIDWEDSRLLSGWLSGWLAGWLGWLLTGWQEGSLRNQCWLLCQTNQWVEIFVEAHWVWLQYR